MNRFITLLLLAVVGIAMLLIFFMHINGGGTGSPEPVQTSQSAPAAAIPPPAQAPAAPETPDAPTQAEPAAAPAPPPARPTPPPAPPAQAATAPQSPGTASKAEGSGKILDISLHFKEQGMFLRVEGDGPLPAKYFILSQPERLVVDLPGSWRGMQSPAVPGNNIVKSARVGRQGNADRLVLDLAAPVKKHELTRVNDNKVEIYFAQ